MRTRTTTNTDGTILVVTLWSVAILSLLALSLTSRVRLGTRHEEWARIELEQRELLSAGIQRSMRLLRDEGDDSVASYSGAWGRTLVVNSAALLEADAGAVTFKHPFELSLLARDEGGKINVNTASAALFTEALLEAGVTGNAAEIASAICDWRDADDVGAYESDWYSRKTPACQPANDDLTQIEELLFVEGVSPQLFFGEDANHNGVLDANEDDGDAFPPVDNADGRLQLGLIDLLTVYGDGTLNVNTAPEAVLRMVISIAMPEAGEAERLAAELVGRRRGPDRVEGTDDDTPFVSDAAIAESIPAAVVEHITLTGIELGVTSAAFRFYARGFMPNQNAQCEGEWVVRRESEELEIVEWHDSQL